MIEAILLALLAVTLFVFGFCLLVIMPPRTVGHRPTAKMPKHPDGWSPNPGGTSGTGVRKIEND